MLTDIKKMLHANFTLNGICEGLWFKRAYFENVNSSDIVIPKCLVVEIEVPYSVDADNPTRNAYC